MQAEEEDGREEVRVVLVESRQRIEKRPYHRQKLVLLLSAMRHYASDLRHQGYQVDIVKASTFSQGLKRFVTDWRPDRLICMAAKDYDGRRFQEVRLEELLGIQVVVQPNIQSLHVERPAERLEFVAETELRISEETNSQGP